MSELIECWNCGKPDNSEHNAFCTNCGSPLKNYCTNPACILNMGDPKVPVGTQDCYCPECGSQTEFFAENLIEPEDYS